MLEPLNLPVAPLKLTRKDGTIYVLCLLRKKRLVLTPEEWVRQHVVYFLSHFRHYPESLMRIEMGIKIHGLSRRCDLVLFDKKGIAKMIVECKAPHVKLSEMTFEQAAHYNQEVNVEYLFLTNGIEHRIYQIQTEEKQLLLLEDVPYFEALK